MDSGFKVLMMITIIVSGGIVSITVLVYLLLKQKNDFFIDIIFM